MPIRYLVELFAREQADELDGDVPIRMLRGFLGQAGHHDHRAGQVDDADGLVAFPGSAELFEM